jgi:hypothetical protein
MYETIAIDWETAEVKDEDGRLVLKVNLNEVPDKIWVEQFGTIAEGRNRNVGAGHWEVSWPYGPLQATVKVTGVSAGTEDAVREALNDLIKHVNENAERDRRAASEQAETDQQTAARTAHEMTERFRSGT